MSNEQKIEEWLVAHVTPKIKEDCDHEWHMSADGSEPEYCEKCGLSFTRYIFCCCE